LEEGNYGDRPRKAGTTGWAGAKSRWAGTGNGNGNGSAAGSGTGTDTGWRLEALGFSSLGSCKARQAAFLVGGWVLPSLFLQAVLAASGCPLSPVQWLHGPHSPSSTASLGDRFCIKLPPDARVYFWSYTIAPSSFPFDPFLVEHTLAALFVLTQPTGTSSLPLLKHHLLALLSPFGKAPSTWASSSYPIQARVSSTVQSC
jgi:hypothetical protein